MGLASAISSAMSGLHLTQKNLEVVSGNIANAETANYSRKVLTQSAIVAGGRTIGVSADQINRQLDLQVQARYRTEMTGGAYTQLLSSYASRLDGMFGSPGGASSIDTLLADFSSKLEALTSTPEANSNRLAVLDRAGTLANQLNKLSADVQAMRGEAETGLKAATDQVNDALTSVARLNQQIMAETAAGRDAAGLLDQRDQYIDKLSTLMDIKVGQGDMGAVTIATVSGLTLLDKVPAKLSFDAHPNMGPEASWSEDESKRSVGTLTLTAPNGQSVDLFASNSIRSGTIAAYRDLRDNVLVEAQAQLDEIAHSLALALSTETVKGQPATNGAQNGYDLDLSGLKSGNIVSLEYTATPGGKQTVSFVRVDKASSLPLSNDATPDPSDRVVGIDFSGGMASVAAQIQAALGGSFSVSNPSGSTLQILDDGAAGTVRIDQLSAGVTADGTLDGSLGLPLFVDGNGNKLYTASFDNGSQKSGFAGRITVSQAVKDDPSKLVIYDTAPQNAGDGSRPEALIHRLNTMSFSFSASTGVGTSTVPFKGSVSDFVREVLENRGAAAEQAQLINSGQQQAIGSLGDRLSDSSKVNIDVEIAHLVQLQTAYSANARVMTVVNDMLKALMQI